MRNIVLTALLSLSLDASIAGAQSSAPMETAAISMVGGEIMKIDEPAQKVTIKHGAMPSMGMDAMTMVYSVREPGMLQGFKAGDKIKFEAGEVKGQNTVMKMEKAN